MKNKEMVERLKTTFKYWYSDGEEHSTCPVCGINVDELKDFISQELDKAREEERFKVLRELSLEIDGVDLDNYITENTDYFNRLGESMMKKVKELVKLKDNK